jgi:diaminohydroxyphosphoribosylaminopyrimidine deaminase/5-amino-6-(5-phosphoribosylamino)uracil reductase
VNSMQKAIALARGALGTTSPNPAVGAVIVNNGITVGEGFTLPAGKRHAEVGALQEAGHAAQGATLFTTLEPCCHYGRTPPCTEAIVAAGIKYVHIAILDPNPNVSGKGCAVLEAAGIKVILGEESENAEVLYEAFTKHVITGLPFISVKYAMSLDGKIATRNGDSKWVSGPQARALVQQLRRANDAILVGINTVLTDNPLLTVRDQHAIGLERQPLRVVLDSDCRIPIKARLLRTPDEALVVALEKAPQYRVDCLVAAGVEVFRTSADARGMVDLEALLAELGGRGIVSILVEGGGILSGSLFDAGLVDKVYLFLAPIVIGGKNAAAPVQGQGVSRIADALRVERTRIEEVGADWIIVGYPGARS